MTRLITVGNKVVIVPDTPLHSPTPAREEPNAAMIPTDTPALTQPDAPLRN